jgi:hypothetical protein
MTGATSGTAYPSRWTRIWKPPAAIALAWFMLVAIRRSFSLLIAFLAGWAHGLLPDILLLCVAFAAMYAVDFGAGLAGVAIASRFAPEVRIHTIYWGTVAGCILIAGGMIALSWPPGTGMLVHAAVGLAAMIGGATVGLRHARRVIAFFDASRALAKSQKPGPPAQGQ